MAGQAVQTLTDYAGEESTQIFAFGAMAPPHPRGLGWKQENSQKRSEIELISNCSIPRAKK